MNNHARPTHKNEAGGVRPMEFKYSKNKNPLQITCHYKQDGADVRELVKQSFLIFTKSCIIEHDEWSLVSGGTPCTQK